MMAHIERPYYTQSYTSGFYENEQFFVANQDFFFFFYIIMIRSPIQFTRNKTII